ncbi:MULTISPECIES: acyl-CoA carboxylase subunit epsilon [Streptomyces]|uniref:acyl-CoA carboxylase subunit epsilon n=1 Tax=Streptomyces TaxID=1883 RepID=UPI000A372BEF|nr:acyl-CoA carboxylase subunit epsilon [Streptomyces sp. NRRL B-24572]
MTDSRLSQLLSVDRGNPGPEELAALTAALVVRLAREASSDAPSAGRRDAAGWRRPERASMFEGPRSWRAAGRGGARA